MTPRRTSRLILRHADADDAPFIVELLTDPDFVRFIGDRGVRDEASAREYLGKLGASYEQHGFGLYVVTLHDGARLGLCGLVRRDTLPHADLGFAFLPRGRGRGYAREAALATLDEAREKQVSPLLAICNQDNRASRKLLEALGFTLDGLTRLKEGDEELCLYSLRR